MTLPQSIQGTWAVDPGDCGVPNKDQIIVDTKSVQFLNGRAELREVTEYEATRLAGRFDYRMADGKTRPYQFTLDAQEGGKVLIMRQYGEGALAGVMRFEQCMLRR